MWRTNASCGSSARGEPAAAASSAASAASAAPAAPPADKRGAQEASNGSRLKPKCEMWNESQSASLFARVTRWRQPGRASSGDRELGQSRPISANLG